MLEGRKRRVRCLVSVVVDEMNRFIMPSPSDPNAPKRGLSAYMFFANEQRDNVRAENQGISFGKYRPLPPAATPPREQTLTDARTFRPSRKGPWREVEGALR